MEFIITENTGVYEYNIFVRVYKIKLYMSVIVVTDAFKCFTLDARANKKCSIFRIRNHTNDNK